MKEASKAYNRDLVTGDITVLASESSTCVNPLTDTTTDEQRLGDVNATFMEEVCSDIRQLQCIDSIFPSLFKEWDM